MTLRGLPDRDPGLLGGLLVSSLRGPSEDPWSSKEGRKRRRRANELHQKVQHAQELDNVGEL